MAVCDGSFGEVKTIARKHGPAPLGESDAGALASRLSPEPAVRGTNVGHQQVHAPEVILLLRLGERHYSA